MTEYGWRTEVPYSSIPVVKVTIAKPIMSIHGRVLCLVILHVATYFVLDGVDASSDKTANMGTTPSLQNTYMTSNGSTTPQQVDVTGSSETDTDLILEPKNCTREIMTTVYVQQSSKCKTQIETCTSKWIFWKKCRNKEIYKLCDEPKIKKIQRPTTEPICCKGLVPYNNTAEFCVKGCETGKYGENCTLDCNCTGNTRPDCDINTGTCKCMDGWTGQNCTIVCDEGFYGQSCDNSCACENNSTCDHVNGTCNCTVPGWTGDTCNTECEEGQYGYYCNQTCSCLPNSTCDSHSGQCQCIAGLTGENCTEVCTGGYFGADCQQTCTCLDNNTRACDPVSGECYCKAGWTGGTCTEYCEPGTYGELCENRCNCSLTEACHPINGECISRFLCSVNGTSNCDPGFGISDCLDIQGNTQLELLHGTILDILINPKVICDSGTNHTQFCVPSNDTFLCECLDGWTGHSCEQLCPGGMYGSGCRYNCSCDNGEQCDGVDGRCFYTGKRREQEVNQNTTMGLVLGVGISSIVVICLVVVCFVMYKRKGDKTVTNVQVTFKKSRSTNDGSFVDNRTYGLHQPDGIGSASRGPLISEDRVYENDVSNEKCAKEGNVHSRQKATVPNKDMYSPVKIDNSSCENFESMRQRGAVGDVFAVQVIDGVYNDLDHRNNRNSNDVATPGDEYSHVKITPSADTYDVFKGKNDSTEGDNMYDTSRELSNTYDVFQKKTDTNVTSDTMYDTNDSVARDHVM